ncbi:Rieske (2Fe-2S) protein [Burkholderia sp. KCJ3K979]|uniref:Rieske (2Fe-2S) protein n=1 Tax=Burkholderia sp. KCJ3K979 TaxID=2759149 RepID=UPI00192A065C|nr:Rieske (2Fe-2S) protein [Burkholderia sp. KCJ3K979]MBL3960994.1 Rieske (2Fe-2S) protein [Burkholderia sp. KCJ3K979]
MQGTDLVSQGYVLACAETEIPNDGSIITRGINGRTIALARAAERGKIVAFDSRCPHMQGPLKFGRVVDGEVVCPWHFLRFNTATGETVGCDSIMHLETFAVELTDGNIYVGTSNNI